MTSVFIRGDRHTHEEYNVMTQAEFRAMRVQIKKCQELMATTRSYGEARKDATQILIGSMTVLSS